MSEEQNPPLLRLKPRTSTESTPAPSNESVLGSGSSTTAVSDAAVSGVSSAALIATESSGTMASLMLKSRTPTSAADAPNAGTELPLTPSSVSKLQEPAVPSLPPVATAVAEGADTGVAALKLRPRAVNAAPADNAVVAPPALPPPPVAVASVLPAPQPELSTLAPVANKSEPQDAARFKLKPRLGPADAASPAKNASPLPPMTGAIPPSAIPPAAGKPIAPIADPVANSSIAPAIPTPAAVRPAVPPVASLGKVAPPVSPSLAKAPAPANPEDTPAFKIGLWVVGGLVVVLIAVGGFIGFRMLMKGERHGPSMFATKRPPAKAVEPVAAEAKPAETLTAKDPVVASPQSLAGKMVGKARDTVAAREHSGQVAGVDEVLSDTPAADMTSTPSRHAQPAKTLPVAASVSSTATAAAEPIEVVPPVEKPAPPPASLAFRTYVGNLRVNGVFQGEPGRAFLNGRMVGVGEMADAQLGIRFAQIDSTKKVLTFEDRAGSVVQRRY